MNENNISNLTKNNVRLEIISVNFLLVFRDKLFQIPATQYETIGTLDIIPVLRKYVRNSLVDSDKQEIFSERK